MGGTDVATERNRQLSEVGAGTLMGDLLRRYWHPIAAVAELDEEPVKPVRVLGEDLVLYRDLSGAYGLLGRHCPHRRADLSYGWIEQEGLRCSYHGWCFDARGACTSQPYEDTVSPGANRFREGITHQAYRVEAKAGLVFAYLGPDPAPLVPTWEPFTWADGFVQVALTEVPCNWLQAQDNSIDPVHFEWLHDTWPARQRGAYDAVAPRHLKLAFDEFEFGFTYRRVREHLDETSELWRVGRVCLWPNALFTGDHFEWRVPIDDEHLLSVAWFFDPVPTDRRPFRQDAVPAWRAPLGDPATGRLLTSHVMNQDFVAWVGQGAITDRDAEHPGRSDRGIVLMRRRLLEEAEAVARGEEPKGLVRDPARNACLALPIAGRDRLVAGPSPEDKRRQIDHAYERFGGPFPFLAGQPDAVRKAYEEAMGY